MKASEINLMDFGGSIKNDIKAKVKLLFERHKFIDKEYLKSIIEKLYSFDRITKIMTRIEYERIKNLGIFYNDFDERKKSLLLRSKDLLIKYQTIDIDENGNDILLCKKLACFINIKIEREGSDFSINKITEILDFIDYVIESENNLNIFNTLFNDYSEQPFNIKEGTILKKFMKILKAYEMLKLLPKMEQPINNDTNEPQQMGFTIKQITEKWKEKQLNDFINNTISEHQKDEDTKEPQKIQLPEVLITWLNETICDNNKPYIEKYGNKWKFLQNKQIARRLFTHEYVRGEMGINEAIEKYQSLFIDKYNNPLKIGNNDKRAEISGDFCRMMNKLDELNKKNRPP